MLLKKARAAHPSHASAITVLGWNHEKHKVDLLNLGAASVPARQRSVRQAWALGGKPPESFFRNVKALAEISAQKRGLTLPENEGYGAKAGEWMEKQAKKDPDQLLCVVVDQAVQHSIK